MTTEDETGNVFVYTVTTPDGRKWAEFPSLADARDAVADHFGWSVTVLGEPFLELVAGCECNTWFVYATTSEMLADQVSDGLIDPTVKSRAPKIREIRIGKLS